MTSQPAVMTEKLFFEVFPHPDYNVHALNLRPINIKRGDTIFAGQNVSSINMASWICAGQMLANIAVKSSLSLTTNLQFNTTTD